MRAAERAPLRSKRGRVARLLAWLVAAPLLLVTLAAPAALWYARSEGGRARVRSLLLAQARARLPGLELGRVDGGYLSDLILRDVEVRDSDGVTAVHADALSVRFDLLALWHRTVAVKELRVQGARLLVRAQADGTLNISHLTKPAAVPAPDAPARASPAPNRWSVHIDRLLVSDLHADVLADPAAPAQVADADLTGQVALDGERLSGRIEALHVTTGAGRLTADGNATIDRVTSPRPRLTSYGLSASFEDADPSRLLAAAPSGRLALTVAVRGAGIPLGDHSEATVDVRLAPAELAGVAITSGHVTATLDGTRWQIGTALLQGEGMAISLTGHGDGPQVQLDLSASASIKGRLPGPSGRVPDVGGQGTLMAHVTGRLPDADVTVNGSVAGLRAGQVRIGAVGFQAHVHQPLSAPSGSVRLSARSLSLPRVARVARVDRLTVVATGDGAGLRVDAAVAGPRVHGRLRARGTLGSAGADVHLQALTLDFATGAYRQTLALRHPARLRFRAGDAVSWNGVAVHGAGFRFTGDATTSGLYRLPPHRQEPVARIALDLRQASFNGLTPIDAQFAATLSRRRAAARLVAAMPAARAKIDVDADLPVAVSPGGVPRLATSGPLRIALRSSDVHLESVPLLEKQLRRQGVSGGVASLNGTVSGDVAHPDVKAAFELRDVTYRNLRGFGRNSRLKTVPGLGGTLTLGTVPGAVCLAGELRVRNAGVLKIDARTPLGLRQLLAGSNLRQAPLQATVTVPGFSLGALSEFTDATKGVSGQLSGEGQLTGTLSRPSGSAQLRITGGKVDDLGFSQILLAGHASDGRVDASLAVQDLTGGTLNGSAVLERGQGDRLQAKVVARALDLRFARLFAPTLRETAGVAQLTASASGTLAAPVLNADLTVERGRLGLIGQPTFRDVRLAAKLRPGRADISRIEARSGDGALSGSGWITLAGLAPQRAVFKAHAHRFLVAAAGSTGALIDGDIAADAALRQDVLAGRVNIPKAEVWLPKGPSVSGARALQKIGEHDDVRFVDPAAVAAAERQRTDAMAKSTPVEIGVRTGPVYIRGKDMDIQLDSTLTVGAVPSGPRAGAPTVAGGIHVRNGRINIQGQRFDFSRGEITFDGSPDINPRLDIVLERQYPDARVEVALRGTPQKPELHMTSDPPVYDQAQIVSLILTGQPGGQPSNGRAFDPTAAVATAVLSKLADKLAPEVGLDVLRVEKVEQHDEEGQATGDANTRIEVGKYISDRVYLSYAHVFGAPDTENQNEAHVEYRLTRRWILETIFGDAGVGGIDALWTLRY